jgi:AcrR family transcriptional regulator
MSRQYAKSAGVRQSIIAACSAAFGESGFHGASMAEIARRAGISHTGLLHHFARKEDLLTAVLELQDERSARYLAKHGTFDPESDPVEVLRGMMSTLIERDHYAGLVELSAVLIGEAAASAHPAHDHFAKRYIDTRSFLRRLFARLNDEGRLTGGASPEQLASATVALTEGLRLQWLYADDHRFDIDSVLVTVLGAFVPELRHHGAE